MIQKLKPWMALFHILLICTFSLLIYAAFGYVDPGPKVESVKYVSSVTAKIGSSPAERITLPCSFWDLPPRTPVTISAILYPEPDEEIFVESRYCPGKIYLGPRLGYEFGKKGQSPSFMLDPASEVHMIETHGTSRAMELRMEFLSPATQRRMTVEAPLLGSTKEIILERFQAYGFPCVLAAAQIIYGLSLLFISICTRFMDQKSESFLWLGLLSLTTGMWAIGENKFSHVIFKNSTMLYMLTFTGFFSFSIPLLRFSRSIVEFENPKPVWLMELFMTALASVAMLLQILGIVSCSTSVYAFYLVLPVCLIFLTAYIIRERIAFHNISAGRFILPVTILTVTALSGLIGHLFSSSYPISSLTQLGILIFLLLMGVTAGLSLKDSIDLKNKQKQLSFEKDLMDIQIKEQKTHSQILSQQEQLLSQQRHDLRHHLNVVKALAKDENTDLQEYLQSLMENIPAASRKFCENQAVNAIISHYYMLSAQKQIKLSLDLTVPSANKHISDSDLCIIFGNLLENAVEACDRMENGDKFIELHSMIQYDILTITMDNSFNGQIVKDGEKFHSSKRDACGIGLSSILSVATKSGGNASFKGNGKVFQSSVYLNL